MRTLLLILLLLLPACNGTARVAVRNVAEIGKHLSKSSDGDVASMGRVITAEAGAAADDLDAVLWGLWTNRSRPSVTEEHLEADLQAALEANVALTQHLQEETSAKIALGNWAANLLMGLLAATGVGGTAAGVALRYRSRIKKALTIALELAKYGVRMAEAETDDDVQEVKTAARTSQAAHGVRPSVVRIVELAKKEILAEAEACDKLAPPPSVVKV